ncbi:hypothetical protein [uncultured Pseudacidovorax sp.]|uniref:hypothetical protein n=1 Tax=uncultured Pseudacidovorax sp. TaxID=679313 RepID=UPI0025E2A61C|nr:hypothetical protein [uncultured Pseudacidovorax sp.]
MNTVELLRDIAAARALPRPSLAPKDRVRHVIDVTQRHWQLPVSRRKRAVVSLPMPELMAA